MGNACQYPSHRDATYPTGRCVTCTDALLRQHRRRAPGSRGVTPAEWLTICQRFSDARGVALCAYCRNWPGEWIDHVVPISRGGLHEPNNVVPACASCNVQKRGRLLSEWLAPEVLADPLLIGLGTPPMDRGAPMVRPVRLVNPRLPP